MTGSLVSPELRTRVRSLATPIAVGLGRLGLTPNGLTVIGFLGTVVAAYAATQQAWLAAGLLVLVFGIFDLFDGALARATGKVTTFGAFLDSTLDRAGEIVVYLGIVWGGLDLGYWLPPVLAASALGSATMVSYVRAKSEGLGFTPGTGMAGIGLAPREVRLVILSLGLIVAGALSSPLPTGGAGGAAYSLTALTLDVALGLITILATITAIQRIFHVRAQAKEG